MNRVASCVLLGLAAVLTAPTAALAHGLGESAADRSFIEFIPLGTEHMLLGWDHLAFIAGVTLLAGGWKTALKLLTIFALGHSTTLLIATLADRRVSAVTVDVVIATSVVVVAVFGLVLRKPPPLRTFGALVFGFGLVHGLGLATRLLNLDLQQDGRVGKVLLFNVGVEYGQVVALSVFAGMGWLARRTVHDPRRFAPGVFGLLCAVGGAAVVFGAQ